VDFVLALHSHLPYVLNHGRWPHGSDWLCEAALDTYLPLLDKLEELAGTGVPAPVTIGFTPVLANQLADPAFATEMDAFFSLRLAACDEAAKSLPATGGEALLPLVEFWRSRFCRLQARFVGIDRNIAAAFRKLEEDGQLEIIGSAATHGYLPLLGRDESIRLQLAVGRAEHRRIFGRDPVGAWLPECAYRPRGLWSARAGQPLMRRGIGAPRRCPVPLLLHGRPRRAGWRRARQLQRDSSGRGTIRRRAPRWTVPSRRPGGALAL
jgi:1,4-alpha-glucan branching enzyme